MRADNKIQMSDLGEAMKTKVTHTQKLLAALQAILDAHNATSHERPPHWKLAKAIDAARAAIETDCEGE